MFRKFSSSAMISLVLLTGCSRQASDPVENLGGAQDVSTFTLQSLKGTRDGELLEVEALYGPGSGSIKVDLHFRVTPPARLESGTWTGAGDSGSVRQRSVTFLGGQSGPPSIGGRFDLIGSDDRALYRITIPLQELKQPL